MGQRDGKNSYQKKRLSAHFFHVYAAIDYLHVRGLSGYSVMAAFIINTNPER